MGSFRGLRKVGRAEDRAENVIGWLLEGFR
jgi:hypothetical protein